MGARSRGGSSRGLRRTRNGGARVGAAASTLRPPARHLMHRPESRSSRSPLMRMELQFHQRQRQPVCPGPQHLHQRQICPTLSSQGMHLVPDPPHQLVIGWGTRALYLAAEARKAQGTARPQQVLDNETSQAR